MIVYPGPPLPVPSGSPPWITNGVPSWSFAVRWNGVAVVEPAGGQRHEVSGGDRREIRLDLDHDRALPRCSRETVRVSPAGSGSGCFVGQSSAVTAEPAGAALDAAADATAAGRPADAAAAAPNPKAPVPRISAPRRARRRRCRRRPATERRDRTGRSSCRGPASCCACAAAPGGTLAGAYSWDGVGFMQRPPVQRDSRWLRREGSPRG